jgi:hypothetical protein
VLVRRIVRMAMREHHAVPAKKPLCGFPR